jgi:hypothetical protein
MRLVDVRNEEREWAISAFVVDDDMSPIRSQRSSGRRHAMNSTASPAARSDPPPGIWCLRVPRAAAIGQRQVHRDRDPVEGADPGHKRIIDGGAGSHGSRDTALERRFRGLSDLSGPAI